VIGSGRDLKAGRHKGRDFIGAGHLESVRRDGAVPHPSQAGRYSN
jgi:hypothetical protein